MKKHIVIIATMLLLVVPQISAKEDSANVETEKGKTGLASIVTLSSGVSVSGNNCSASLSYGVLKATVTDEDGNPAIGASILVVGTTKGANVRVNGMGTVPGLKEGTYKIKISSIGYDPIIDTINIVAGDTLKKSFELEIGEFTTSGCGFYIDDRMIDIYEIGSVTTFSATEIQRSPAADRKLFNIRDDRNNDTKVLIDRLDVGNQFEDYSNGEDFADQHTEEIVENISKEKEVLEDYIKLFPNPTDGRMTLILEKEFDNLFVLDMNGEFLFNIDPKTGSNNVNLSNYPNGVYFLKYTRGGIWGSTQIQLRK